jgi:Phospholipase_D-nuclease N-terminal
MQWTFGTFLWSTLVIFFWVMVIWMFINVFADIFRRDMSGWAKAGWIFLIVVLPFLGILIYLIARPKVTAEEQGLIYDGRPTRGGYAGRSAADEIARAAKLHEEGKISSHEFEQLKQQVLSY